MSRKPNLATNTITSHTHVPFDNIASETTQQEVLSAIKNINLNVGEIVVGDITVESSDTITHTKLDTLNSTVSNKVLNKTTSSIDISGQTIAISNTGFNVDNQISNYALENGGNLAGIKSQVDTLSFITVGPTDFLQVYDTNSKAVLDNIKTNTDALDNFSFTVDAGVSFLNTHDVLTTDAINNKHLDKTTDSVDITNQNINVNMSIESSSYDLLINGPTLWADSLPAGNPFFADPNGREGWYYDNNSNINNKSNIYWYGNPTSGNLQENDMAFSQLSGMYSVITCDYVDNGSLTIPTMGIYSQPTGTNDFIVGFAHSRWVYQLSTGDLSKLRKGEIILIYTGSIRPSVFNELPSYQLQLATVNGDALGSEIIAYMTINTQATSSKIGYLLQYVGYLNSVVGFNKQYGFKNSKERVIQNNLYSGSFNVSNQITGFALESGGNLASIKTNSDKFKYTGDDLKAVISNTGFDVNNQITGFALESGGNLASIKTNSDKLKYVGDDLKAVISNTGFDVNNQITGFALESGGNLASIKTNSDKLKYVGDDLKAVISNTSFDSKVRDGNNNIITSTIYGIDGVRGLDVSIKNATPADPLSVLIDPTNVVNTFSTNLPTSYPIDAGGALSSATGALNVNLRNTTGGAVGISGAPLIVESNLITGFALESGGNLAGIKTNTDKFKFTGDDLKTTITNASLIVENGTNPLDVNITSGTITGANGKAYLYSGDEATSITATTIGAKNGIDSNIINSSIDTHLQAFHSGSWINVVSASNGHLLVNSSIQDGVGTDITSTLNGAKQSLDVNVSNTVPVSGTFYPATQPISGSISLTGVDTSSQTLNVNLNAINNNGSALINKVSYSNKSTDKRALDVEVSNSFISTRVNDGTGNSISSVGGGLSVNVNNASLTVFDAQTSAINTKLNTTTYNSLTGLNVYNIYPTTKQYTFGGIDNNATAYRVIGGNATSSGIALDGATGFSFGLANPRVYRASLSTGTPNSNLFIDYVDGTTGNLVENSGPYPVVATSTSANWTLLPSMIGGPIKFRTSTTIGSILDSTHALYISPDANTNRSIGFASLSNYGVAVFSIPNGYIGYITAITAAYSTAGSLVMVKWGADGIRQVVYKVNIESDLNIVVPSGYEGMIGGIFTAGESIAFANNLATANKLVQASITLRQI